MMFSTLNNDSDSNERYFQSLKRHKTDWIPNEGESQALDLFINKCRHDIKNLKPVRRFNLSHEERRALSDLRNRPVIVIKPE